MIKNKTAIILTMPLLILIGLSCSLISKIRNPGYFEKDGAEIAAKAIREKIGKPFRITELRIDNKAFIVRAQDPDNLKNVNEYKYLAGFVTGPSPVKLNMNNRNLEKSTFPFDEINFAAIPDFTKEAIEKSGIEGAKINRISLRRGRATVDGELGHLGSPRWHIEIKGTRENVSATADENGKLTGMDLSQTSRGADYKAFTRAELQKAQKTIKDALGEKVMISEFKISKKYLMFETANPENAKVSDSYLYDINGLEKRDGLKSPRTLNPNREDFSIADIDLGKAEKLIEKTKQRVDLTDGTLSSVIITREKPSFFDKVFRIIWDVSIEKGVNTGDVSYDNAGNEIEVEKNGDTVFKEK